MKKHNYFQDYFDEVITLEEAYKKVTDIVIALYEIDNPEEYESPELDYIFKDDIFDENKLQDYLEFYNNQLDSIAHRIAHQYMLDKGFDYTSHGLYCRSSLRW